MSEPTQKKRLWLRILLGVSLAMNLLVIGLAVGAMMRLGGPDGMRPPPASLGSMLYRAMPGDHRSDMHKNFRDRRSEKRKFNKQETEKVAALLRAVPFDPQSLNEVLKREQQKKKAFFDGLQASWLDRVTQMSDAERAEYADRVEEFAARRSRWSGGKHGDR